MPSRPASMGATERRCSLAGASEEQGAARAAVEAVHRVHVCAQHVPHPEERHVLVVAPSAMDQEARRLVGHDDVGIDEEEIDRARGEHRGWC